MLPNGVSAVDSSNTESLVSELQKQHQDYWQQSQYLSEKLTALQNEVADFKQEEKEKESSPLPLVRGVRGKEGKRGNDTTQRIHASIVRQSSHKHYTYDKVCLMEVYLCSLTYLFLRVNLVQLNRGLSFLKIYDLQGHC